MLASPDRVTFTLGAFLQKHWNTEDKSAKPNNHAGLRPVGD